MQRLIEKKSILTYKKNYQNKPSPLEVSFKDQKFESSNFIRIESIRSEKPALISARKLPEESERIRPQAVLSNVSCFRSETSTFPAISNFSLKATSGQLIGITGQVGSGKTSLLMGILGELSVSSGEISCTGKIAYASQTPWVYSGTLLDNIVFGMKFDEQKYCKVIEVCDLGKDIASFPKQDQTEIGQRGVILSGGQRARVSLARAIYSDADIYLLDDPLSAVDAQVGKHLFDKCIKEFLSGRVRILVTHQLKFLKHTDSIVLLQNGSVFYQGTYSAMLKEKRRGFSFLSKRNTDGNDKLFQEDSINVVLREIEETYKSVAAVEEEHGRVDLKNEEEDRTAGSVKWSLYWKYFRASLSIGLIASLAIFFAIVQGKCPATHPVIQRCINPPVQS